MGDICLCDLNSDRVVGFSAGAHHFGVVNFNHRLGKTDQLIGLSAQVSVKRCQLHFRLLERSVGEELLHLALPMIDGVELDCTVINVPAARYFPDMSTNC